MRIEIGEEGLPEEGIRAEVPSRETEVRGEGGRWPTLFIGEERVGRRMRGGVQRSWSEGNVRVRWTGAREVSLAHLFAGRGGAD